MEEVAGLSWDDDDNDDDDRRKEVDIGLQKSVDNDNKKEGGGESEPTKEEQQ